MRLVIMLSLIFSASLQAADSVKATIVKYQILEPGIEPYISRMIVTAHQVRMDDDENDGSYLLFSRECGLIESINHSEQSVFVIHPKKVSVEPPFPLTQKTERLPLDDAPAIGGKKAQQFQLLVNGEHCQSIVSVEGLLTDTIKAWRKFRHVLAGEHAATLSYVPADQLLGCDLALNTFSPGWFLDFGLPVQSMEVGGRGMLLIDYTLNKQVDPQLFVLPEDYHRYSAE
ncbi:MAG: hypothetical protein GQ470_06475 [Gammaproteobacteria bacterium]|nr:hypothetical protein [Gammaproteobacteria bacterium]